LASDGAFRRSLPMGTDPTDEDDTIATVTKVMAEMVNAMRDDAATLSVGAAAQLTRRHVDRTRPVAVRPLASLAADPAGTAVRWRHGLVATVDQRDEGIVLRLPDRTITFPPSCGEAVRALHCVLAADAASMPGLDRADATVLIRRLLREAVVVPTTAG
jgi:bifunctional lysine-specific demethylase and histidyl-hydroxylase NO66